MSPGSGNFSAPCSHGAPLTEASRGSTWLYVLTCHACAFSKAMQSWELSFPSASCKLWWSILHCGLGSWSAVLTTQWLQVVSTVQSQVPVCFFPHTGGSWRMGPRVAYSSSLMPNNTPELGCLWIEKGPWHKGLTISTLTAQQGTQETTKEERGPLENRRTGPTS